MEILAIFYFGVIAFAAVASYEDAVSSTDFIYFGGMEGSGWVTDKYGYHSMLKELRLWGPIIGAGIVAPFLPGFTSDKWSYIIGMVIYGTIGAYRLNEAKRNRKKNREARVVQNQLVLRIRAALSNPDPNAVQLAFDDQVAISKGGRTAYGNFGWLWSTNPDIPAAVVECRQLVIDWVKAGAVFPK